MKNSGTVAQPASVYYLDNLQVSYPYPYTRIDCEKGPNASYRFGFNGKENDMETLTQDYGFRIYNPGLGRFLSVDPLTQSYPWYTPYQFAGNSPIANIDFDGGEPSSIVTYDPSSEYYKLTKSAIALLSLMSGVPEERLAKILIKKESQVLVGNKNGGLTSSDRIALSDDHFDANDMRYGNTFSSKAINNWIVILSHEVGHIPQADKLKSKSLYFTSFALSYGYSFLKNYSFKRNLKKNTQYAHDYVPREIETARGTELFESFSEYLDNKFGVEKKYGSYMTQLFLSRQTDVQKIEAIKYQFQQDQSMLNSLLDNYKKSSPTFVYEWNAESPKSEDKNYGALFNLKF